MIRVWLSPFQEYSNLSEEVASKARALTLAAEKGARFLALPVHATADAAAWILASFYSPMAVVPVPEEIPPFELDKRLCQLPVGVLFPHELSLTSASFPLPPPKPLNEIWAVIFTSGSSGTPKGIALSGTALKSSALAHARHSQAQLACWLLDLPLYHMGGFSVLSRAFFLGAAIAISTSKFDSKISAEWIRSGKVQGLSLVPTTLFRLLREPELDFSEIELILLGGGAADPILVAHAHEQGAPVRLTYGMTEHASQIASERQPGLGLEALPGVELQLNVEGEILIRSDCLAAGAYVGGKLVALPLQNGFFATGDLGELRNGVLSLNGRKSELIVSGGKKIFPVEVEQALAKISGIRDCAVTSLNDAEWGEILCAAIVEEKTGSFDQESARFELAAVLEKHKLPKHWILVDSVPRSGAGKILRQELRNLVEEKARPSRS